MPKPKYEVTVQYRSTRTITVSADDAMEAIEKAGARMEKMGLETIAFSASPAP